MREIKFRQMTPKDFLQKYKTENQKKIQEKYKKNGKRVHCNI